MTKKTDLLLAGDLGGTKTNLAILSAEAGLRKPLEEATLRSADYSSLEALVKEFLANTDLKPDRACFGVAGPVISGQATITNLPWVIKESQLVQALNLSSVQLLNDLVAIANAVPFLEADDVHTLNEGERVTKGAIAVIAPGTGLGEAYLTWDGARYRAYASEGGHVDFAPTNMTEIKLLRYLWGRFGRVSYERICSGSGIPNIYDFLKQDGYAPEPAWLAEELAAAEDRTPIIIQTAIDPNKSSELCVAALNIFVSVLGAEAGNMALKVLASGGVYLGGGIPLRIIPMLENERFMESFRRKGRFSKLMSEIPVHIILNPKAALIGAAGYELSL